MSLTKLIEWLAVVLMAMWGLTAFGGCNATPETVKILDGTLKTLNTNGVVYSGTLEGPTEAGFEMYSGGRVTTGGWISLRLQSPVGNPMAVQPDEADVVAPDQPAEPDGDDVSFRPDSFGRKPARFNQPTARTAHWKPPAQPTEKIRPARVTFDPNEIRRVETVKAGEVTEVAYFRDGQRVPSPE